jgi:hypothetical protein
VPVFFGPKKTGAGIKRLEQDKQFEHAITGMYVASETGTAI